jgi:hypothetical protein
METLIAGAAAVLVGLFAGRRLSMSHSDEVLKARLGNVERLMSDNGIKATSPETLDERFSRLESLLVRNNDTMKEVTAETLETHSTVMSSLLTERLQAQENRVLALEDRITAAMDERIKGATQNLISRDEVQQAFARVAQIEAQRINSERQAQSEMAQQQLRAQQVFGAVAMPPDMNVAINNQLAAFSERLQQIGATMP